MNEQLEMRGVMRRKFWSGSELTAPVKGVHDDVILVFGSNPKGRHGLGVANLAMNHWGAVYSHGRGLMGQSYALVTKNLDAGYFEKKTGITYHKTGYNSVTIDQIKENIREMYACARENPTKSFVINYIVGAKNLNGYSTNQLVGLFLDCGVDVPINIVFHESWKKYL